MENSIKVLIDSNVAVDYLSYRQPFYEDARLLIEASKKGMFRGSISASAVTDVYYIVHQFNHNKKLTMSLLHGLLDSVSILTVTDWDIRLAADLNWKDFEDAVQYQAGVSAHADYIVTRNGKDFKNSTIPVITPSKFIKMLVE
jgi:predicted nucleic acid-binding protein